MIKKKDCLYIVCGLWLGTVQRPLRFVVGCIMARTKQTARRILGWVPTLEKKLVRPPWDGRNVKRYIRGRKLVFIVDGERGDPISIDPEKAPWEGGKVKDYIRGRKVVFIVGGERGDAISVDS